MSNPGSPTPRGRGRGRWKEMSSNERVANWVNQREAKRLNKERWANHVSGNHSPTVDENVRMPTKKESVELESSLARAKAKRQNVPLYVPPSLRAKKEPGMKKDPADSIADGFTDEGPGSGDTVAAAQKSAIANICTFRESFVGGEIEQRELFHETSQSRGRGRGRKKPEVEIYVPRALRAAKHESALVPGIQVDSENKDPCLEDAQRKTGSADDSIDVNVNVLPSRSFVQSSGCFDDTNSDSLHDRILHNQNSGSEVFHLYGSGDCQSPVNHDSATKKLKYESTSCLEHTHEPDAQVSCRLSEAVSTEQTHTESPGNALTFEFYDPAVIAFLPSCSVRPSLNITVPYSMDSSGHTQTAPQGSSSSQKDVTIISNSSISSAHSHVQHMRNEYQPTVSIDNDSKHSLPWHCTDTKKDSPEGSNNYSETCFNQSNQSFSSEQMVACDLLHGQRGKEGTDILISSVVDDCYLPELNKEDDSGCDKTYVKMPEDPEAVPVGVDMLGEFSQPVLSVTQSATHRRFISQEDVHSSVLQFEHTTVDQLREGVVSKCENSENGKIDGADVSHSLADDDDDTWDTLFDDNGDCLDEMVMEELTDYVGKVEIDKPKINYLNYEPKEVEMDYEAFSHILEIYDFSPELATCDLITAFREFSSRGFDIKWVDDTHALGVFSSAIAAKEALRMIHPLLKVRPLSEASKKGQSKARHCQEFLQPYKPRPETTSIAARRLVAGALGMMPQVSKEVRELERKKLKEAKERRRQERQQKIDVWDGSFRKCAMDEEEAAEAR